MFCGVGEDNDDDADVVCASWIELEDTTVAEQLQRCSLAASPPSLSPSGLQPGLRAVAVLLRTPMQRVGHMC